MKLIVANETIFACGLVKELKSTDDDKEGRVRVTLLYKLSDDAFCSPSVKALDESAMSPAAGVEALCCSCLLCSRDSLCPPAASN